jgi:hypothetical protein
VSCKTCFSENKWNKVKVYAYVSKFVYFSYFWTIIGGSKYAIVTTNTYSGPFLERISRKARSEGTSVLAEPERMVLHGTSQLMRCSSSSWKDATAFYILKGRSGK